MLAQRDDHRGRPADVDEVLVKWAIGPFFVFGDRVARASEKLLQPIAAAVRGLGYELVGVEHLPQGRHSVLRVYIDTDAGITVDDCERVSRQVSGVLDVEDLVRGHYLLEVSSPGLDRPLFTAEHYARFIGHKVKLRLSLPLSGRRNFTGLLQGVQDNEVVVAIDEGEELRLSLDNIDQARLVPEF